MKDYHMNTVEQQFYIRSLLAANGLDVDDLGQLHYGVKGMDINASALYLMRHGETEATQNRVFMSNDSANSHLCAKGRDYILSLRDTSPSYQFDVVIICSDIPRVMETGCLFREIFPNYTYVYATKYRGIDNGGWEGKTPKDLKGTDYQDYVEREEKKNVFAKSARGGSWGDVLVNTVELIQFINTNYAGKRVLLISQGSILQALILLSHQTRVPWEKYDTRKLYNLDKKQTKSNYGKIECLYDERRIA